MSKDIVKIDEKHIFHASRLLCHVISLLVHQRHMTSHDSWLSVLLKAAFVNKLDSSGKPAQLVPTPVHPIVLLILLLCIETMQALQQREPDCRVPGSRFKCYFDPVDAPACHAVGIMNFGSVL